MPLSEKVVLLLFLVRLWGVRQRSVGYPFGCISRLAST